MVHQVPHIDPTDPAIIIDVGNTRVGVATWHGDEVKTPLSVATNDKAAFREAYEAHVEAVPKRKVLATVIGSVVPDATESIRAWILSTLGIAPLVIGETIPLPMDVSVKDQSAIGTDRVCAAAAAHDRLKSACAIVDFGTAVTVDLVDDGGILLGGAILPGLRLQLRALHDFTARLPAVEPAFPETSFGRDTTEAIQIGVCRGLVGAVRWIIEAYATQLNRWPQVVATGGDLEFMRPHCDFVDSPVPYLTLRGVGIAFRKHLATQGV